MASIINPFPPSPIPHRSVHLDARMNHARNVIQPLSGIHDFVRSVQLVARPNHARNAIQPLSGIHDFVQQVARYGVRLLFLYAATIGIFAWGVVC